MPSKPPTVPALDGFFEVDGEVLLRPSRAQRRGIGRVATVSFAVAIVLLVALLGADAAFLVIALTISVAGALIITQRGVWVRLNAAGVVARTWPRTTEVAWADVTGAEVVRNGRLAQVHLQTAGGRVVLPVPGQSPLVKDPTFDERAAFVLAWAKTYA